MKLPAQPIEQALTRESLFRDALFERPSSLSALLPYDDWIVQENIFCQKDGSLGVIYRLDLVEHEPLVANEILSVTHSLQSWFSLPENCTMQVIFDQTPVSPLDTRFARYAHEYPRSHRVSQSLFESRLKYIREACTQNSLWTPFERTGYVAIRYYPSYVSAREKKNGNKNEYARLFREMDTFTQELRKLQHLAFSFEKGSKIALQRLDGPALVDLLRRFFNPRTYYKRSFAPHNVNLSISEQVLYCQPTLDHIGIEREGLRTRTISLKTSPQFAYPGGMANFTRLPFPFRLALNFSFPTPLKVKQYFNLKEFFLQNSVSARAKRQQQELLDVQKRLAADERCLHMTFNVVLEAESEEKLDEYTRDILSIFHNDLHCEAIVEDNIGLGLCLNTLPLHYSARTDYSTQRYIKILRTDAVNFLPVFDSFKGLSQPLQLYLSREQNFIRFSLLENETSNHTVVLADSGSGKSAFVIDCIQAAKRLNPEPLVFVIDKGSSYYMLAKYFDANVTVFERTGNVPFTPFRGHYDEDKIAVLTHLIISAVKLTSPSFATDSDHLSAVSKALKLAYTKKAQLSGLSYVDGELVFAPTDQPVELSMDDFIAELGALPSQPGYEQYELVTQALAQKLKPFYGDGPYAMFFNQSTSQPGSSNLFYIYDLDALDSDPILQSLMTMAVFEEIRQIVKRPEHRERESFIVLEEFAMVGRNNPTAREFIIDFAERLRKLGCWLIALTPRPQNYFQLEVGQALWGVADNFIFLQMSEDNVRYLKEKSELIDEAGCQIINSLRTKRGQYADVFYMNKKKTRQGAFRFVQTPLDRWLAPTNARDSAEANRALKKFKDDKWKALQHLAETFPHGTQDPTQLELSQIHKTEQER